LANFSTDTACVVDIVANYQQYQRHKAVADNSTGGKFATGKVEDFTHATAVSEANQTFKNGAVNNQQTYVKSEWNVNVLHCNGNSVYIFLFWELRGLSPNFHINVSVSDLYIPRIDPHISSSRKGIPIVGIYNSLTDT
jgi:hypothetical protein